MILTSLPTEARVLAEMICNPEALEVCADVESSDFVDMRHVLLFHCIRNTQHKHGEVTVDGILEEVEQKAMDWGSPAVAEAVNAAFIRDLIARAPKAANLNTVRGDIKRLRSDRDFRESLRGGR